MGVANVLRGYPREIRKTYTEKQRGIPLNEPNKMLGTPNKSINTTKKDMGEIAPINMIKYQQPNPTNKKIKRQHNPKGNPFNNGDITQGNILDVDVCSINNTRMYTTAQHNNKKRANNAWGIPHFFLKKRTTRLALTT